MIGSRLSALSSLGANAETDSPIITHAIAARANVMKISSSAGKKTCCWNGSNGSTIIENGDTLQHGDNPQGHDFGANVGDNTQVHRTLALVNSCLFDNLTRAIDAAVPPH